MDSYLKKKSPGHGLQKSSSGSSTGSYKSTELNISGIARAAAAAAQSDADYAQARARAAERAFSDAVAVVDVIPDSPPPAAPANSPSVSLDKY